MSLEQEITGLKLTLELLEEEKKNLMKHIEIQIKKKLSAFNILVECVEQEIDIIHQLEIQEENYLKSVKEYKEKTQNLLSKKEQQIVVLKCENAFLRQYYIPPSSYRLVSVSGKVLPLIKKYD